MSTATPRPSGVVITATPTATAPPRDIAGEYSSTLALDGGRQAQVNLTVASSGEASGTLELVDTAAAIVRTTAAVIAQTAAVSAGLAEFAGSVDSSTGAFDFSGDIATPDGTISFALGGAVPTTAGASGDVMLVLDGVSYSGALARGAGPTPLPTPSGNPTPTPGPSSNAAFVFAGTLLDPGIFVMNRDGSGKMRVHHPAVGLVAHPAWSPDGSTIAFSTPDEQNDHVLIGIIAADGSGFHRLAEASGFIDDNPAWSPDGGQIVFTAGGGDAIDVMNADGSNRHRLATKSESEQFGHLSWSPDGTRIAFEAKPDSSTNFEIFVMAADGSNRTRLTTNAVPDRHPDWSPDGTTIIFTRDNTLQGGLMAITPSGGTEHRLVFDSFGTNAPNWSADGHSIAYANVFGITVTDGGGGHPMAVAASMGLTDFDYR